MLQKDLVEEEIDLRELFQIIWNKKVFIITFSLCITIFSGIYSYSKIPIYEVKSYVEIGFIDKEILEELNVLEQKLKVIFSTDDFNEELNSLEKGNVSSIKQIKNVKNFLEIKTEAYSNEAALIKNQAVLKYIQTLYEPKIKEYEIILNNDILNTKREIDFINNVEIKNILAQINILKEQEIKNIDRTIENLKSQDIKRIDKRIETLKNQNIKNIDNEIKILRTQNIPNIKNEIELLSNSKINSLKNKIIFYSKNLEKYLIELNKLTENINKNESTSSLVASVQILNYQNFIINAQNQIKDLELQIEVIQKDEIPKLINKLENINIVQIKDLENKKENILNIEIEDLENQRSNIFNIEIKDLENKKLNVSNETVRKLQDKIDIELKTRISQLNERIETFDFKKSEQNLSNTKLVGDYIINNNPVKPKKSLIIVVSFITSFISAIFIVFILNFINNSRIKSSKQE